MSNKILVAAAIVLAFVAGGFVGSKVFGGRLAGDEVSAYERAVTEAFDAALTRLEAATARLSERFEEIDNLKTAQETQLNRYRNADHLKDARRLGLGPVSGDDEIERLVAQGRLVKLEDNPYYYIMDLDYSVAYVTPDAAALLDELGERFHARLRELGLPRYRYCISSVLRTGENQAALRQINPNATSGTSTHEFGTTLDVVYHRYEYVPRDEDMLEPTRYAFLNDRLETIRRQAFDALGMRYWQELQGILGRTLIKLQDEGKVKVTLERRQPVFHFTVAQKLAD